MNCTTHAQRTAGLAAAVARASVQAEHVSGHGYGLGYGWQTAAVPCSANDFALTGNAMTGNAMTGAAFNGSTKRSPRRLGQRST